MTIVPTFDRSVSGPGFSALNAGADAEEEPSNKEPTTPQHPGERQRQTRPWRQANLLTRLLAKSLTKLRRLWSLRIETRAPALWWRTPPSSPPPRSRLLL